MASLSLSWCFLSVVVAAPSKPHIILQLVDDWGWANVGFHNPQKSPEVATPNIDQIASQGMVLSRAYAYRFCSPSRSSLNSGRLPVHVNTANAKPVITNPNDPVSGFAGIPRNMTGLGTVMLNGGYSTHQIGKWDAGMATPDHTPLGRGYSSSFGYFHHDNDYWDETAGYCDKNPVVDLWHAANGHEHPATHFNGSSYIHNHTAHAPAVHGHVSDYEEYKFGQRVVSIIQRWADDPSEAKRPLFINYDSHVAHEPLHVPQVYYDQFDFMKDDYEDHRRIYAAMIHFLDDVIGNITTALKSNGMWNNTIWIGWSDNGGPTFTGSSHTANNFPHRGSKGENFEGGVRVNAYIGGGWFNQKAPHRAGSTLSGIAHITDLYATFAGIAGVDCTDKRAATAGLPPVDAVDMMPYWLGKVDASPRNEVHHDPWALTRGDLKILTGDVAQACWTGPRYPNTSIYGRNGTGCQTVLHCGNTGCLFNVSSDPTEHIDIADDPKFILLQWSLETVQAMATMLADMMKLLAQANKTIFSPDRGKSDPRACTQAIKNGGFWGPFLP